MKLAAYCRVSTEKDDQINSLEAQKKFFAEYSEKNGHQLIRLYADEGISGTKIKNRVAFQQLIRDAHEGLFDMVVVKDISRFARNTVDLLQSTRKLSALGIETLFLTANMTTLGNSEFVLTVFGALAQEESANTSKRIKFGKQINAEKGRVPNLVYGYDKTIGEYFTLSINSREAAVVREIFSWYVEDGFGAWKIASMLNDRGLKTKRGYAWSQNAVCRILNNELYAGKVINGKQEVMDFLTGTRGNKATSDWMVAERPELAIVNSTLFQQAQGLMRQRGKALSLYKERQSNQHLFSTLIQCKECGRSFRRLVRTYKYTYVRWVCAFRNGQGAQSCPNNIVVDENALVTAIQSYLAQLLSTLPNPSKEILRGFHHLRKFRNSPNRDQKKLRDQLSKLQSARRRYMDLYADSLITRDELNQAIGGLGIEMAEVETALRGAANGPQQEDRLEAAVSTLFPTVEDFSKLQLLTNAQLKRILRKIEVDQYGNVDIYLQPPGDAECDEPSCYGIST